MTSRKHLQSITANTAVDAKAWAKELGCTVAELRIAMRAVGNSTARVRTYLAALNGRELDDSPPAGEDGPTSPVEGEVQVNLPPWPGPKSSGS